MYAHKVIESINNQLDKFKDGVTVLRNEYDPKGYYNTLASARNAIESSFKFHIESYKKAVKTVSYRKESQGLFIEDSELIRMPYPTIWLDYVMDEAPPEYRDDDYVLKRGILVNEEAENIISLVIFSCHPIYKEWLMSPLGYIVYIGEILHDETSSGNVKCLPFVDNITKEDAGVIMDDDHAEFLTLSNFLMLINCKNIEGVNISAPSRLNKKRAKKGKAPIFTYKVLKVIIGKNRVSVDCEGKGGHARLHFCRGHFKRYSKDNPLFGKYHGLYWWQPQVRGEKKAGVVIKDYSLKIK